MTDSYDELTVVYKNGKPDLGFYAGEMVLFFKEDMGNGKIGYFANTEGGEQVIVGVPECVATFKGKFLTQWTMTKHTIGKGNSELYYYEKKIKISTR
jgi:hypothetical protein